MTPPADLSTLSSSEKDALIAALLARVKALLEEVEGLRTENAALRDKLSLPPKTPRNSSKPPSQERKAKGETEPKPKSKPHAGAYRPLHPNPTRCREVWADCCPQCQADVTAVAQGPLHTYDWIEIPEITPDVTRVTLYGGTCPCCRARFKAPAPSACPPGSPFGPNLRAFVLYLRFAQAIPFERLARLLADLFGLEISEGALANLLRDSAAAFTAQRAAATPPALPESGTAHRRIAAACGATRTCSPSWPTLRMPATRKRLRSWAKVSTRRRFPPRRPMPWSRPGSVDRKYQLPLSPLS